MIPFDYRRAEHVGSAIDDVTADPRAAYLAGGTNLVDHLRLGITAPELLVDIRRLPLDTIDELDDGGLRIGATVTNSALAAHPLVRRRYPILEQAVLAGASGQLRNQATTGGNLLQRTRCEYFRDPTTACNKRDPGSGCSALNGYTRHAAIFGTSDRCIAVHPSDMAVAMTALGAEVVVEADGAERRIPVAGLHRLPGDFPERDTVLGHGDLITAVDIPPPAPDAVGAYRKARDRASFAFALVSLAAVVRLDADDAGATGAGAGAGDDTPPTIDDATLVLGSVAHRPWRATRAEQRLRGAPATVETFAGAADAELASAQTLPGNAYKVPLARNMIIATLRDLTAAAAGREADRG